MYMQYNTCKLCVPFNYVASIEKNRHVFLKRRKETWESVNIKITALNHPMSKLEISLWEILFSFSCRYIKVSSHVFPFPGCCTVRLSTTVKSPLFNSWMLTIRLLEEHAVPTRTWVWHGERNWWQPWWIWQRGSLSLSLSLSHTYLILILPRSMSLSLDPWRQFNGLVTSLDTGMTHRSKRGKKMFEVSFDFFHVRPSIEKKKKTFLSE